MIKKGILLLVITASLLCGLNIYFYVSNLSLRSAIGNLNKEKEKEFKSRLGKERALVRKDLDEKYRADLVSFEAMHKRLEIEKSRIKELQEKLKKFEKKEKKEQKD